MSKETASPVAPYDFEGDPDGIQKDDFGNQDPLLQLLLGVVPGDSESDSSVGITVTVNGAVISGLAVSFERWGKLWAEEVRGGSKPLGDALDGVVSTWVKESADMVTRREAEDRPTPGPRFLHLTNAEVITGGFRQRLGLMRVRRSRIDAWTLSQLPN